MNTIHKYQLPITDVVILEIPRGAMLLSVQAQNNRLTLWALVDPDQTVINRTFYIVGTGHPIPEELAKRLVYIGTAQTLPSLVWHVFSDSDDGHLPPFKVPG